MASRVIRATHLTFCVCHFGRRVEWKTNKLLWKKTPLFRCPSGFAKAFNGYKAYANGKRHQRLLLPGYANEPGQPGWHLDKETCECFVRSRESAAPFPFSSPLPFAPVPWDPTGLQREPGQHHGQAPKSVCVTFNQRLWTEAETPEAPSCKTNQIYSVNGNNKSLASKFVWNGAFSPLHSCF